jgi:hypothetical protein
MNAVVSTMGNPTSSSTTAARKAQSGSSPLSMKVSRIWSTTQPLTKKMTSAWKNALRRSASIKRFSTGSPPRRKPQCTAHYVATARTLPLGLLRRGPGQNGWMINLDPQVNRSRTFPKQPHFRPGIFPPDQSFEVRHMRSDGVK